MSAGEFTTGIYETNAGNFARVRIQPETLGAVIDSVQNAEGAGPTNQEASAKVSGGKREIGVITRTVTLAWDETPPEGYSGDPVTIPALTPAFYDVSIPNDPASIGLYLETAVRVVGRSPERVR